MLQRSMRLAAAGLLLAAMPSSVFAFTLPGVRNGATTAVEAGRSRPPVVLTQGTDVLGRLGEMEEQMRRLNGRVEELSFQLLQAQEQMRKQQEDLEFRLQELENGGARGGAGAQPAQGQRRSEAAPAAPTQSAARAPAGNGDEIGRILGESGIDAGAVGSTAPRQAPNRSGATAGGSQQVAAVKPSGAGDLYGLAYNYLLAGDYRLAEDSFRQYSQTYPNADDAPDAKYWLGESLFQQQKFTDAAEVFLNAQKEHPESPKAPEMMLKLGMSLAKLDNRETACVTYREVEKRYPSMTANVKKKLKAEETASRC